MAEMNRHETDNQAPSFLPRSRVVMLKRDLVSLGHWKLPSCMEHVSVREARWDAHRAAARTRQWVALDRRVGLFAECRTLLRAAARLCGWGFLSRGFTRAATPTSDPGTTPSPCSFSFISVCCSYRPEGSIRMLCLLTKMSTKNAMFWPRESDLHKIPFLTGP